MRPILLLHILLMLLASTDFTILTLGNGGDSWRWCYFKYATQSGFGYEYVSQYSLPIVLTYLAAFSVGLVGFTLALKQGRGVVGTLGVILSLLGLVSFMIEGSHWVLEHNWSWLAFSPAAMLALAAIALLLPRRRGAHVQADQKMRRA